MQDRWLEIRSWAQDDLHSAPSGSVRLRALSGSSPPPLANAFTTAARVQPSGTTLFHARCTSFLLKRLSRICLHYSEQGCSKGSEESVGLPKSPDRHVCSLICTPGSALAPQHAFQIQLGTRFLSFAASTPPLRTPCSTVQQKKALQVLRIVPSVHRPASRVGSGTQVARSGGARWHSTGSPSRASFCFPFSTPLYAAWMLSMRHSFRRLEGCLQQKTGAEVRYEV